MFLAKLNVFIPCFVLVLLLGTFLLGALFALGLTALGLSDDLATGIAFPLSFITIIALFIRFWIRKGSVLFDPDPARESRYRIGHGVLATTNALLATSVAIPIILAAAFSNPNTMNLLWIAVAIFPLALVAWPIGLYMIWTSKP